MCHEVAKQPPERTTSKSCDISSCNLGNARDLVGFSKVVDVESNAVVFQARDFQLICQGVNRKDIPFKLLITIFRKTTFRLTIIQPYKKNVECPIMMPREYHKSQKLVIATKSPIEIRTGFVEKFLIDRRVDNVGTDKDLYSSSSHASI